MPAFDPKQSFTSKEQSPEGGYSIPWLPRALSTGT